MIAFQLALVVGAPWGALTQGGRVSVVVAYCAVGILANAATPSPAERALWLPVVAAMFLTSLHVARRRHPLSPNVGVPTGAV